MANNTRQEEERQTYVYPHIVMLRCFIVRIWMRIPSDNALHSFMVPLSADFITANVADSKTYGRSPRHFAASGTSMGTKGTT